MRNVKCALYASRMTDPVADNLRKMRAAVEAVVAAFDHAVAVIAKMPDAQQAFDGAGELEEALGKCRSAVADLRVLMVERIWVEKELGLTELGKRTGGVTKQRASQRLQEARKIRESRKESP